MFDVGFLELVLVAVVALLLIGPEHMPEVVRYGMATKRRLVRLLADTRREIESEIGVDDIRRQIHNEEVMRDLRESREAIERAAKDSHDG